MIIPIFVNDSIVQFNDEGIKYLKKNINNKLVFLPDDNLVADLNIITNRECATLYCTYYRNKF